jgi:Polysaccharide lyase
MTEAVRRGSPHTSGRLLCAVFILAAVSLGTQRVTEAMESLSGYAFASDGLVMWSADHETGDFSQWEVDERGGIFNTGTGTASITTDVAHSGHHAAKLTITQADGMAQAVRIFRWGSSEADADAYYSAWYYFPQRYRPAEWWNIFQFKSQAESESESKPTWSLNVGNRRGSSEMYLYLWDAIHSRSYQQLIADLPERQWVHIEAHYLRSVDPVGHIAIWQNGLLLWDINDVQTAFAHNVYWSVNSYTDNLTPSTSTIYVDDAVIGRAWIGPGQGYVP